MHLPPLSRLTCSLARRATRVLRHVRRSGIAAVAHGWRRHRSLLLGNAAYTAAIAAAAAALVTRTTPAELLTAALAGAVAIQRALQGSPPRHQHPGLAAP